MCCGVSWSSLLPLSTIIPGELWGGGGGGSKITNDTHIFIFSYGGGVADGRLATAAAALSAGLGSCSHLTCVAGPYLDVREPTGKK